jgi:hypothetical protein
MIMVNRTRCCEFLFTATALILMMATNLRCTSGEVRKDSGIDKRTEYIEGLMKDQDEKIVLLSVMKDVSYDTLKGVLTEYYFYTEPTYKQSAKLLSPKEAVDNIAEKYRMSRSKAASLVFLVKYEMSTFDEKIEHLEQEFYEDQQESGY